jgi:hypothetical protein
MADYVVWPRLPSPILGLPLSARTPRRAVLACQERVILEDRCVAFTAMRGLRMNLPLKVRLRIRRLLAMMDSPAVREAETARQKLVKLLAEHRCAFKDLPDILAAADTAEASPYPDKSAEADAVRSEAWQTCADLAQSENILAEFDRALDAIGLVGERRNAKLLYLAITSRLLDRPASLVVKRASSGGKSFTVDSVLRFFPNDAFYALTAMSDRNLAYSSEPLKHRTLVIYEAPGIGSPIASYLMRTLLSEGRLRYEVAGTLIEREGPTGLIVTTTSVRLHAENETRMLSLTLSDSREQTAAILRALAKGNPSPDLSRWHALQTYLAASICEVVIPYASDLAEMVPPVDIRLRRDFATLLTLVRAHALLHQPNRRKDPNGRLIAEIADYAVVRGLVADLVAEGTGMNIKPEVRETVKTVEELLAEGKDEATQEDIRGKLKLDKSSISRRVAAAIEAELLRNREIRKGRPARLVLGEPLPVQIELLPHPDRLRGCTVAEGIRVLPPANAA